MTQDERDQLLEDIKRSDNLRRGIVEMAERSRDFDVAAAWEEVETLDGPIRERLAASNRPHVLDVQRPAMPSSEFLDLSTRLVKNLKRWVDEASAHHGLSPQNVAVLLSAQELIDQLTVTVTRPEGAQ